MIGKEEHELHRRRRGRNMALGGVLLAFVVIMFGVTIAKMGAHAIKPEMSWSQSE